MSQEKILSDFHGGMNALAAVDKLDPTECLLAENVRFDETGSIQSAGAYTHQNTAAYAASGGTSTNNIHSLFWNPAIGGVAGVGQDVFTGPTLGGMSGSLAGQNAMQQKMSFASAPNRVYFDVGSVGYWTDMTNLLTVDWMPPSAVSAVTTTKSAGATNYSIPNYTSTAFGYALGTQAMQGIGMTVIATVTLTATIVGTNTTTGTVTVNGTDSLYVNGAVVGTSSKVSASNTFVLIGPIPAGFGTNTFSAVVTVPLSFGNANSLWGYSALTPAQINLANSGFVFTLPININTGPWTLKSSVVTISTPIETAYQQSGGLIAATGEAGTLTGTYSWKITFVAANGEESDASIDSTNVVLSAQAGSLTNLPVGDARTVARNVYRKGYATSTGLTLHYLVGTVPDNTTLTYSDNVTDLAALTAGVILAGDVPGDYPNSRLGAQTVRFPVLHYDRIFWVSQSQPNQVIWSKPLNGFAYPAINFFNVGDSSHISRIISIFGELIIFKTNSQIWRLTGSDESSFDLTQTPSAASTDESFSIVALPDKILFHNRWGFWIFNGYTSVPLTPKLDLWMKQEDRTNASLFGVNGFHPPEVASQSVPLNFDATGNSEKYYLAYAEANQAQNNAALVFDVKHGNITKRQIGFPLPLSLAIDPVNGYVYMGDNLGFISLLDDWNGTNGGGSNVNFDFQHGYQDFQRGSTKSLWALEFFLNTNGQSLTPTVYYDNGSSNEALAPITTTSLQRVVRPVEATAARKMQNFSFRLNGSLSKVNVSGTPRIQVVHVKALYDVRVGRARTGQ